MIQEKVRELIRLAKEQGYLTYEDLDEHLPEGVSNPDHLDAIISQLRGVEIEIIEASDVDRVKEVAKPEEEEEKEEEKGDVVHSIRCSLIHLRTQVVGVLVDF